MSDHHDPSDNSTGHEWDGIRELKNPAPTWWSWGFYLGLIFVTCYYIIYPSSPFNNGFQRVINGVTGQEVLVDGHTKGIMHLIYDNEFEGVKYYAGEKWTQAEIDALKAKGYNELTIKAGDLKFQDGWTYVNETRQEIAEIESLRRDAMSRLDSMSVEQILADDDMKHFALGRARVLFGDNCAACHGSGGAGVVSAGFAFPNLSDDDWLFGGWPAALVETITEGREGAMPAKGGNDELTDADVDNLAGFVTALGSGEAKLDADGELTAGADRFGAVNAVFQENCAACHGMNAKGSMLNGDYGTGAVNLTDAIYRFGSDMAALKETIGNGRKGKMPAFGEKLDATSIKILAVKVHQLGGGMDSEPMM
ncbi:MAG: c-type cytochrome [Mariprofundaceae bacterium]|nr:c-type cytochrome [Mariprofundaceae bacterium]